QRAGAGLQALADVVDLLVQVFQLGLVRRKLGLQFGGSLLAFRCGDDRPAHINHAHLAPCSSSRRRLRADGGRAQYAQARQSGATNQIARIHCFLLVEAAPIPFGAAVANARLAETWFRCTLRTSRGYCETDSIADAHCSRQRETRSEREP